MEYLDFNNEIRNICKSILFDPDLKNYKKQLIDWQVVNNLIILPHQFFFINDFVEKKNIYVHPNVEKITGYPVSFFKELGNIFTIIHPDDRQCVFDFSNRTVKFAQENKEVLLSNPMDFTFMIDFRIKKLSGEYIRVNRNSCCLKTDKEGNLVYAFVLFTDITSIKSTNIISFSFPGEKKYQEFFVDLIKKYNIKISFTKREREVLKLLIDGYNTKDISKNLFISESTIITHRKNMLKKTNSKNTAELVKFALENNIINSLD